MRQGQNDIDDTEMDSEFLEGMMTLKSQDRSESFRKMQGQFQRSCSLQTRLSAGFPAQSSVTHAVLFFLWD